MNLRNKMLLAFMVLVVILAIMGSVSYIQFNGMSDNVDEIVDKNAPAAEIIMDMRIALGWMFAAHAELVEGVLAYQETLAGGGTVAEAEAAAEPAYTNAMAGMNEYHDILEEAHEAFNDLGYFSGAEAEEMNALIEVHDETIEYFRQLEQDYRATDWEAGEATMELLDASAVEADAALEQVEEAIDSYFVELNNSTRDKADTGKTIILVLLIAGIVVGIILALFLANMITTPVKKLTDIADKVSKGDLDIAIDIKSKDEIGELAESFDRMVVAVRFLTEDEEGQ